MKKYVDSMPIRFVKLISFYYTNAIIRKIYLKKLGFIMGEGSYSNLGLHFTPNEDYSPCVIIGKNVSIGPGVTFLPNSEPNNSELLKNNSYVKNNLIKKNTQIFVLMPGITIKRGSIIGAGAIVTKNTEEFCTYAGVPAKKIRNYIK